MGNYEGTELFNQPISKGLEELKRCLERSSDEEKINALKEALKYGLEGFKWVEHIVKSGRGTIQLIAYDLLWENANLRGKKKLLNYLSKHPEICTNYIEKVLEPSLIAMREEQEQRHQTLAQICHAQELIRQQYQQALFRASKWKQDERDRSIYRLPSKRFRMKQDEQRLKQSQLEARPTTNCVSTLVRDNSEKSAQSALINTKNLSQEASALKAKLDQQTALINNLLPELALISKLFEAEAKKHLFEAQTFANAIEDGEKVLLQIEVRWQELESITACENASFKLIQRLEFLISEMQDYLILLRQIVARAITTQLHVQHHYNLAKKAATYCKHRAKLDWQEGNQNWARESLIRRKTYLDTATILKFSLEQQAPQLDTFKCYLFVLQSWLSLAKEMKDRLNVGSGSASAQIAQALLWRRIEFPYSTCMMAEWERRSFHHDIGVNLSLKCPQ
jgi:phage shock protein A